LQKGKTTAGTKKNWTKRERGVIQEQGISREPKEGGGGSTTSEIPHGGVQEESGAVAGQTQGGRHVLKKTRGR